MKIPRATMTKHDDSLTFIKFVAIALVVMVHVSAPGFVAQGPSWPAGLFYDSLAHICVPLFFMVTGVVLLGKAHTIPSVLRRMGRIAIPLIGWSVIYRVWDQYYRGNVHPDWVLALLLDPFEHLWFLYALMAAYVFLPLLAAIFQGTTTQQMSWILGAWFVGSSVVPLLNIIFERAVFAVNLSYVPIYGGYMLLGAFLYRKIQGASTRQWLPVSSVTWLLGTLCICIGSGYYMLTSGKFTMLFIDYWTPSVVITSAAAFVTLKLVYGRIESSGWLKPCLEIGRQTFGIYLVHVIILIFVLRNMKIYMPHLDAWARYPIQMIVVLLLSWLTVIIIQRIPILRALCPR